MNANKQEKNKMTINEIYDRMESQVLHDLIEAGVITTDQAEKIMSKMDTVFIGQ